MKLKTLLSLFTFIFFSIIGGGSFSGEDFTLFFIIAATILIPLFIVAVISGKKDEERKKEEEEREKERIERMLNIKKDNYNKPKKSFIDDNGIPDKTIAIEEYDFNSEIHVYENKKEVFILGNKYNFSDIISCTFSDSPTTIKGKINATTKTNTGSMVGRAIVGDVIAGPAGAIIGGSTAKKNTEFIQENDTVVHDYTVIININSITNPILRIHTGERGKLTNEIVALMNVIIARK